MTAPTTTPPAPIWEDEASGLAVWVNGGLVELTLGGTGGGWSGRLTIDETLDLPASFADAIAEATGWAVAWDATTCTYRSAA